MIDDTNFLEKLTNIQNAEYGFSLQDVHSNIFKDWIIKRPCNAHNCDWNVKRPCYHYYVSTGSYDPGWCSHIDRI